MVMKYLLILSVFSILSHGESTGLFKFDISVGELTNPEKSKLQLFKTNKEILSIKTAKLNRDNLKESKGLLLSSENKTKVDIQNDSNGSVWKGRDKNGIMMSLRKIKDSYGGYIIIDSKFYSIVRLSKERVALLEINDDFECQNDGGL